MRGGPVVAIDGPSGAGKSTVAHGLARKLGLPHLDTGALYRAVTLAVLRIGVDLDDGPACAGVIERVHVERRGGRTFLDGEDVEEEIRGSAVTAAVSTVSAHPEVRTAMVPLQRAAATTHGGVVEGRDIGTVVFPDADLKIFLTASQEERARRRAAERGVTDLAAVEAELAQRDAADAGRAHAPLVQAEDAWEVDTTTMDADDVVDAIAALAETVWERTGTVVTAHAATTGTPERTGRREPSATTPDGADVVVHAGLAARRALPRVVVVGRPNVGKSTLVNRIIGYRAAIVEAKPGITRDRTEHTATWQGRPFLVVDTGGWEHRAEGLAARVVEQAETAIAGADLVLFVVDVTVGALADDEAYARMLRRSETPVLLVANKFDSDRLLPEVHDLYGLGIGDPLAVSAAHGRGVGDLLDRVVTELPEGPEEIDESDIPRVAVVGRPNVGKSSLFNRLLGEERSIVDAVPHTTRDAVDTYVQIDGEPWVFIDTAGLRRRYRHGEETELYSADRTRMTLETAHLVLFVVDGSEPLGEQDQRLAATVRDAGCGTVLVVNKWDLVDEQRRVDLEAELDRLLSFASWAPRVNVSARTGRGIERIVPLLRVVHAAITTRIPTAELNAWLEEATARHAPQPAKGARRARIRYITQVATVPPTFVAFANTDLATTYVRYLQNALRDRYGFTGAPIVVEVRRGGRDR